ncbi:MAG: GNAT family N-acetyltransferase [Coriobacteriia bacterium]
MTENTPMDTPHIEIRAATIDDASLVCELGARTFRDAFATDNTEEDMSAYLASAFSIEIQQRELRDPASTVLVAFIDDAPVGYARLRTGQAPACVNGERPVEIVRLYSAAEWVGAGVGPVLMRECLNEAASLGCDIVWLDVWELNPRAIAFYIKWGFATAGRQQFVLGDDVQDDLIMARPVRIQG